MNSSKEGETSQMILPQGIIPLTTTGALDSYK